MKFKHIDFVDLENQTSTEFVEMVQGKLIETKAPIDVCDIDVKIDHDSIYVHVYAVAFSICYHFSFFKFNGRVSCTKTVANTISIFHEMLSNS